MRFTVILAQTLLFAALAVYVCYVTDREWRALETLRFSRSDPRPAWPEVETRFRDLSAWLLQNRKAREQRRAAAAFRFLRKVYAEEARVQRRLAEWLRAQLKL